MKGRWIKEVRRETTEKEGGRKETKKSNTVLLTVMHAQP